MNDITYSNEAEEALESLYISTVEHEQSSVAAETIEPAVLEELRSAGAVLLESDRVALSGTGIAAGRDVVRRHRLAERLLTDVLGSADASMHDRACEFEHVLNNGLDEQICTLLGHPRICPHGRPIPEGECCRKKRATADPVIVPLAKMKKGEAGTVTYINASDPEMLNKLMAMGVLPGTPIELIQSFPSFVFQAGQSQFAVDREISETIFVRRQR